MSASSKPVPLAIPNDLFAEIQRVAKLMNVSQQALMKGAMEIGLEDLKLCDYNPYRVIADKSHRLKIALTASSGLNEPADTYGASIKKQADDHDDKVRGTASTKKPKRKEKTDH